MRELDRAAPSRLIERPQVRALLAALAAPGEETRIVGGAVRNALLGRAVTEVDFATTALPRETMKRARAAGLKAVPTGIEHGTVTVVADGEPFEVTTLREDVETDGRHAVVRFGRSFEQDALRRDFTMNALSVDEGGRLHDYTEGVTDLAAGRVRFIGDARRRIREDFLRTLRFFRFSAEYAEGPLDPEGLDAAIRERDGLAILSRERIRAEFLKLLAARRAEDVVALLSDTGLLLRLVGQVADHGRFARAVAAGLDSVGRLAGLLVLSPADPSRLRDALRLSNAEMERLRTYAAAIAAARSLRRLRTVELRRLAAEWGTDALSTALAALDGEGRPSLTQLAREQASRFAGGEPAPAFPLTGRDLMRAGMAAGPALGYRLNVERQAWLAAGAPATWSVGPLDAPGRIAFFGWDDAKHRRNLEQRGLGFDAAARIFGGETDEVVDEGSGDGERRVRAVGRVDGLYISVVYTDRGATRWIISARAASRRERMRWNAR